MFRKACLNVIQARQVAKIAKKAGVTRENLYRSFSAAGNPTFETLHSVLEALGLQLGVQAQARTFRDRARKSGGAKRVSKPLARRRKSVPQA